MTSANFISSVSRKASGEIRQNVVDLCGGEDIANICSNGYERTKWGNCLQSVVLADLQGKGHVRQRSISADLIFWFFFIKEKELGLPAAMSGTM